MQKKVMLRENYSTECSKVEKRSRVNHLSFWKLEKEQIKSKEVIKKENKTQSRNQ